MEHADAFSAQDEEATRTLLVAWGAAAVAPPAWAQQHKLVCT
jgi:hypothetical protein